MNHLMRPLRLAGIGCGSRTRTYLSLAARQPERYQVVAAADPNPVRLERIGALANSPDFRAFPDAMSLLAQPRLADIVVIGTQDAYHVEPCLAALERGYDVLLEKPIAPRREEVLLLARRAHELQRRVMVCHVLRYTLFYQKVKSIIGSGQLGELVAIHASEGVGTWHQVHSFVRGHWAVSEVSSPMILAKCCHDLDILAWLMDAPCTAVSSFGSLRYFCAANRPEGAPNRCTDGCPVGDSCSFNALRYLDRHRGWLDWVMDGGATAPATEVVEWLKTSPWGRCAYACDNTVVDRQVVALEFAGGRTASLTMTAFDTGRTIEIMGTRATLRGGSFIQRELGCDLILREHASGDTQKFTLHALQGGYAGHGGGDAGLINQLYHEMTIADPSAMKSSLANSVESHLMAFAAEQSRLSGRTVRLGRSGSYG